MRSSLTVTFGLVTCSSMISVTIVSSEVVTFTGLVSTLLTETVGS